MGGRGISFCLWSILGLVLLSQSHTIVEVYIYSPWSHSVYLVLYLVRLPRLPASLGDMLLDIQTSVRILELSVAARPRLERAAKVSNFASVAS